MATPIWTDSAEVQKRLGVAATAAGYDDSDIDDRIGRARTIMRAYLQATHSPDVIDAWTTKKNTPPMVQEMCADLTAAYVLQDFFGQSIADKDSLAYGLCAGVMQKLEHIRTGKIIIVEDDGDAVEQAEETMWSNTQDHTPHFSVTNPDDDRDAGTLDGF